MGLRSATTDLLGQHLIQPSGESSPPHFRLHRNFRRCWEQHHRRTFDDVRRNRVEHGCSAAPSFTYPMDQELSSSTAIRKLHPTRKRFVANAICRLEWASSFRTCRHTSPASGSCSDQDETVSTPLPEAGQRRSFCHVVYFVFTRPSRPGFRPQRRNRTDAVHAPTTRCSTYRATSVFHRSPSPPVRSDGRGHPARRADKGI